MKIPHNIIDRLISKATQAYQPKFSVSAIGINHKGEMIGVAKNETFQGRHKGGIHAEEKLINRYKGHIKNIIICRTGKSGTLLPIHPCSKCEKLANKYDIKIIPLLEII